MAHTASDDSKELKLHFIEKAYDCLTATTRTANRTVLVEIALSLILIALALGAISSDQTLFVSGFKFIVKFWFILLSGSWIVGLLFIIRVNAHHDAVKIRASLSDLYNSFDCCHDIISTTNLRLYHLTPPTVLGVMIGLNHESLKNFNRLLNESLMILGHAVLYILPITAQVVANLTVIEILGLQWWIIVSLVLSLMLTVFTAYLDIGALVAGYYTKKEIGKDIMQEVANS